MSKHLQFDPFLLNPDARALFKRGQRLPISSKNFEMLLMLIQNRDSVVTKKDLLIALWPDASVEEANITQSVYSLRKLLGDDPKRHQYIATVSGRGYRFIAPVNEVSSSEPADAGKLVSPDSMEAGSVGLVPVPAKPTANFFRPRSLAWLMIIAIFTTVVVTKALWPTHTAQMGLPELEQRQLTFNSSENAVASGSISPDGKYLAYADWTGLHVKNIESGSVQNVTDSPAAGGKPVIWAVGGWLADSERFVANALVRGGPPELWLVAPVSRLLTKIQDDAFGWYSSPDGSAVAFTRNNISMDRRVVSGREIWAYHVRTGKTRQLVAAQGRMRYSDLKWAPNGKTFAYIAAGRDPGTLENAIEECDGAGYSCRAVLKGLNIKSFTFLRDGRLVVSKVEPEPNGTSCNLWITATGNEALRRLTDWQGSCLDSLSISFDGSKLALRKYSPLGTTYLAELLQNGTKISSPVRFNYNRGQEGPQAWLHDSRTVLLASNQRGHWEILKQAGGDQSAQPLVLETHSTGRPSVTPDGQWILYMMGPRILDAAFYRGPVRLMRVAASGGIPAEVAQLRNSDAVQCPKSGEQTCIVIRQSEDGKRIVFHSLHPITGLGPEIASYPVERADLYNYAISADASRVALTNAANPQIDLFSLLTGSVKHVAATSPHDSGPIAWMPGDEGFFVPAETPAGMALLEMDLTGKTHVLWNQKGATRTWGIPSPDGRLLAILNWTVESNIWTIRGF